MKLTRDQFEILLADVIDTLYVRYKENFCDWENKTHKLGWFKEGIKAEVAARLDALSTGEIGERSG